MRNDRKDLRRDRASGDTAAVLAGRSELRKDEREMVRDRRDVRGDVRGLRRDRRELRHDRKGGDHR